MAKINVYFNDKNYFIDESSFFEPFVELKQHLSTTMNGSGSVINFGGSSYNVDSEKLSDTMNEFISHLGKISGSGYKVVVNGIEYNIDSTKLQKAISDLEAVLSNLNNPDDVVNIIILDESTLDQSVLD